MCRSDRTVNDLTWSICSHRPINDILDQQQFWLASTMTPNELSTILAPEDDWRMMSDFAEKRRAQNRLAQRNYRQCSYQDNRSTHNSDMGQVGIWSREFETWNNKSQLRQACWRFLGHQKANQSTGRHKTLKFSRKILKYQLDHNCLLHRRYFSYSLHILFEPDKGSTLGFK